MAWKFGKTIEKTSQYKFDPFNSVEFCIKCTNRFSELHAEVPYITIQSQLKKEFKFAKEAKIIFYLHRFMIQNLITMFDLSRDGRTSGQETCVDSIQKFNDLRIERLKDISKNRGFYDNSKEVLA
jgi:hypothetical protein